MQDRTSPLRSHENSEPMNETLMTAAGMISREKAEEILRNQFPDFPEATLLKALVGACTDAR